MTTVASQTEVSQAGENKVSNFGACAEEPNVALPAETILRELVQLFKLLADDTRIRILSYLQQTDELNVGQFCSLLQQRQPSVSHHLALLREAGLLDVRRAGKHNFYRLVPARLEQLITMSLGSSPGQPARICFDRFELRYAPTTPAT